MGLFDTLVGDAEARAAHEKFADRVTQGAPDQGYSEKEALHHHQQVAGHLSNDEYQHAAMAAFERMSPEQRKQFRHTIDRRMAQHPGHKQHGQGGGGHGAGELASLVGGLHAQDPGMIGNLLGGGGGGGPMGSIGKMALGGIAAMAVKQAVHR